MSFLAARSLTEVLVSLTTNIFLTVLIWGAILGFLLIWLKCSFRLLNFLWLRFFQKSKRVSLKLEGDDFDWVLWSVGTFIILIVTMNLELDNWAINALGIFVIHSLIKPLIKPK